MFVYNVASLSTEHKPCPPWLANRAEQNRQKTENEKNQNRAKKSRESDILFCRQLRQLLDPILAKSTLLFETGKFIKI